MWGKRVGKVVITLGVAAGLAVAGGARAEDARAANPVPPIPSTQRTLPQDPIWFGRSPLGPSVLQYRIDHPEVSGGRNVAVARFLRDDAIYDVAVASTGNTKAAVFEIYRIQDGGARLRVDLHGDHTGRPALEISDWTWITDDAFREVYRHDHSEQLLILFAQQQERNGWSADQVRLLETELAACGARARNCGPDVTRSFTKVEQIWFNFMYDDEGRKKLHPLVVAKWVADGRPNPVRPNAAVAPAGYPADYISRTQMLSVVRGLVAAPPSSGTTAAPAPAPEPDKLGGIDLRTLDLRYVGDAGPGRPTGPGSRSRRPRRRARRTRPSVALCSGRPMTRSTPG